MNENQSTSKIQEILQQVETMSQAEREDLLAMISEMYFRPLNFKSDNVDDYSEDDNCGINPEWEGARKFPKTLLRDNVKKYTLRVTLKGLKPAIFRKFEVPSNITLRNLGELILDLIGWSGYHLQQFRAYDRYYAPEWQNKDMGEDFFAGNEKNFRSEDYTIGDVLSNKGKSITFEYDFGDGWQHEVKLSSVGEYQQGEACAVRFIDGRRACPIEDCGGIWGYEALCAHFYGDKSFDEEYEKEFFDSYIDEDFDPEFFDFLVARNICEDYTNEIVAEEGQSQL